MNDKTEIFEMPSGELHDELIQLRQLCEADLDELYSIASDPLIWEQHPSNDRWKRDVFERFFEKAVAGKAAFAIIDRKTERVIGSSRYYDIGKEPDTVAIGYTFLSREFWGGEYNRSVKKLMLEHAFRFVSRAVFHIGVDNVRSQKAIEKLGAVRSKELMPDDDSEHARFEYLIEKSDWESIVGNFV